MALDKSKFDSFYPDNAKNKDQRRQKLIQLLEGSWVNEDIQEIERVVSGSQEGWAMWRHRDDWREL